MGLVELFFKDCFIKIFFRGVFKEFCFSLFMYNSSFDENFFGLVGGVCRMLGKFMGWESKDRMLVLFGIYFSG